MCVARRWKTKQDSANAILFQHLSWADLLRPPGLKSLGQSQQMIVFYGFKISPLRDLNCVDNFRRPPHQLISSLLLTLFDSHKSHCSLAELFLTHSVSTLLAKFAPLCVRPRPKSDPLSAAGESVDTLKARERARALAALETRPKIHIAQLCCMCSSNNHEN